MSASPAPDDLSAANESRPDGPTLAIAVTGDTGFNIFTQYRPGSLSIKGDDRFYKEIAFDLDVPNGAAFFHRGLKVLLPSDRFSIGDSHAGPVKATLPSSLHFLEESPGGVLRIKNTAPCHQVPIKEASEITLPTEELDADILAIYDASDPWRRSDLSAKQLGHFFTNRAKRERRTPCVFVELGDPIPAFRLDRHGVTTINGARSPLWDTLREHWDDVAIICSADSLRRAGAALTRRLSIEQYIQDTITEMRLFDPLRYLSEFKHLIIRSAYVGALHVQRNGEERRASAQYIFAPNARGGIFRDDAEDGRIVGRNVPLVACLLNELRNTHVLDAKSIANALKAGLFLGMALHDKGFPCPSSSAYVEWPKEWPSKVGSCWHCAPSTEHKLLVSLGIFKRRRG